MNVLLESQQKKESIIFEWQGHNFQRRQEDWGLKSLLNSLHHVAVLVVLLVVVLLVVLILVIIPGEVLQVRVSTDPSVTKQSLAIWKHTDACYITDISIIIILKLFVIIFLL